MPNYNEQLDELFDKWKKVSSIEYFFHDGLMYRGDVKNENWRSSGNESEMWDTVSKRVMFIMKDVNTRGDSFEDDDDLRGRIFKNSSVRIYRNMSYWLYGLLKTIENGQIPEYTFSVADATQFFDDTPVSYVNVKKQAGKDSVSYSTLAYYIEKDKDFIKKEIEILNPDIILCCAWTESTDNQILDFLKKEIYTDIIKINDWMYYSESKNKLVIDTYHPTTRKARDKDMYNRMMLAYKEFLENKTVFSQTCRNK